jgi:hypothetical protein
MIAVLQGATAMGCATAALVFFRFWRQSLDRFFLFFAMAFVILAIDYAILGTVTVATEWRVYVYGVRLVAFLLIVGAIGVKNRSA